MSSPDAIFEKVKTCLSQALGVKPEEVVPEAALVDDLGAESIDFVDIVYRLEKSFDIKIPRGELFPQDLLRNPAYVNGGKLTPAGAAELRNRLDFTLLPHFDAHQDVDKLLSGLFTVRMITDFVTSKLQQAPSREPGSSVEG